MLYGISILVVFLCLAALYESWSIPFSVILVVPLGVLGALLAATVRGLENDVFFQVGLLTTVGLVGEERDSDRRIRPRTAHAQGMTPIEAARGSGASAAAADSDDLARVHSRRAAARDQQSAPVRRSQHAIGTGVIGGMLTATFLAIFMIPMFFVVISKFSKGKDTPTPGTSGAIEEGPHGGGNGSNGGSGAAKEGH